LTGLKAGIVWFAQIININKKQHHALLLLLAVLEEQSSFLVEKWNQEHIPEIQWMRFECV
jgi:hypothetical protein